MSDHVKTLERYPNLAALLEGRCGPISQWPGVPSEIRAMLEENKEALRVVQEERARGDRWMGRVHSADSEGSRENERLRAALIPAEEWMAEDGCDCGTDEPGTCALCLTSKALRGAQPESHGPLLSVQDRLDLDDLEEL